MIRPIAFIDTWAASLVLWKNRSLFEGEGLVSVAINSHLKLAEWKTVKSTVARCLNAASSNLSERASLKAVAIEKLYPMAHSDWSRSTETDHFRLHLPMITNPLAEVFSGTFKGHLPVGQLTFVDDGALSSAVNGGEWPRYHLVIDVKKPEPDVELPAEPEQTH